MSYASSKEDVEADIKAESLEGVPALSFDERFAAVDRKKLLRRIDIRIMPIICVTYMVVRLDLNSVYPARRLVSGLVSAHAWPFQQISQTPAP